MSHTPQMTFCLCSTAVSPLQSYLQNLSRVDSWIHSHLWVEKGEVKPKHCSIHWKLEGVTSKRSEDKEEFLLVCFSCMSNQSTSQFVTLEFPPWSRDCLVMIESTYWRYYVQWSSVLSIAPFQGHWDVHLPGRINDSAATICQRTCCNKSWSNRQSCVVLDGPDWSWLYVVVDYQGIILPTYKLTILYQLSMAKFCCVLRCLKYVLNRHRSLVL